MNHFGNQNGEFLANQGCENTPTLEHLKITSTWIFDAECWYREKTHKIFTNDSLSVFIFGDRMEIEYSSSKNFLLDAHHLSYHVFTCNKKPFEDCLSVLYVNRDGNMMYARNDRVYYTPDIIGEVFPATPVNCREIMENENLKKNKDFEWTTAEFSYKDFMIIMFRTDMDLGTFFSLFTQEPLFKSDLANFLTEEKTESSCPICLLDLTEDVIKLNCNHLYHLTCLAEWYKINKVCPYCRKKIYIPRKLVVKKIKKKTRKPVVQTTTDFSVLPFFDETVD